MNDDEFGRTIHQRLLANDPIASEELCSRWLEPLVDELSRAFPEVARRDDQTIWDAAIEALFNYVRNPGIFRPDRSSLRTFLFFAARGDLLNALQRQRHRDARERPVAVVEDLAQSRNDPQKVSEVDRSLEDAVLEQTEWDAYWPALTQHFPDERDRQLVALMLDGERKTERYAELLGLGHLARSDQQREVKRHKDRIGKRLRRLGEKLRERS